MIVNNEKFNTPPWNATIWRYMSFEKFLDLVISKSLFFSNLGNMTDAYEAQIPEKNQKKLLENYIEELNSEEKARVKLHNLKYDFNSKKNSCFVNCWIQNPNESYALWKIFTYGKTGVAIKTNTKNLKNSINKDSEKDSERIFFGKINYTDFIKEEITFENIVMTKREPYSYENEVRLIILKEPKFKETLVKKEQDIFNGIRVKVDTELLIQEIYLSPFRDKVFSNVFSQVLGKFSPRLVSKINNSEIKDR